MSYTRATAALVVTLVAVGILLNISQSAGGELEMHDEVVHRKKAKSAKAR